MRPFLSVATIISRAIELNYPLVPVLESVKGLADEIVVNVDTTHRDGTLALVFGAASTSAPQYRIMETRWNWDAHDAGGEFRRQTNIAFQACLGDWILYLQADEVIHQDDHDFIRWLTTLNVAGVEFTRLCFWKDLKTLRRDWTLPLVRMFRRGLGRSTGDSMNCEVEGRVWPTIEDQPAIYHYSRLGTPQEIGARIRANDIMHHREEELDPLHPYDFELRTVDGHLKDRDARLPRKDPAEVLERYDGTHPTPILKWFQRPEAEQFVGVARDDPDYMRYKGGSIVNGKEVG